jgi:hypothetical protein
MPAMIAIAVPRPSAQESEGIAIADRVRRGEGLTSLSHPATASCHLDCPGDGVHFYTRTKAVRSRWPDPRHRGVDLGFPQNR